MGGKQYGGGMPVHEGIPSNKISQIHSLNIVEPQSKVGMHNLDVGPGGLGFISCLHGGREKIGRWNTSS